MRPVGEVREALFNAALVLTTPERAPTLLELAHHARVGYAAARRTVSNMRRAGVLEPVRDREVDYRHKPVKEYSPCRRRGRSAIEPAGQAHGVVSAGARATGEELGAVVTLRRMNSAGRPRVGNALGRISVIHRFELPEIDRPSSERSCSTSRVRR